jgi:hypothetical protein
MKEMQKCIFFFLYEKWRKSEREKTKRLIIWGRKNKVGEKNKK